MILTDTFYVQIGNKLSEKENSYASVSFHFILITKGLKMNKPSQNLRAFHLFWYGKI